MKLTITIEAGKTTKTIECETEFLTDCHKALEEVYDEVAEAEGFGARFLVLTDLDLTRNRSNIIPYIKSVRDGSHMGLKEAKEAVEAAVTNHKVLVGIKPEDHERVMESCRENNLGCHRVTSKELVCLEIHES
ncbi:MAG: hypothetical protein ACRD6W_00690 [Nitrososphaerales archaeon]